MLPYALWNLKTEGAKFEQDKLRIRFVKPEETPRKV